MKNGSEFIAPASDGLTRPEGATGNYFKWLGSDDKLYVPGDSVPADVTTLTARFVPDTYTVIVTTDTLPDGKTGKAYSHTLTAISTAPITWSIDEGVLPAGLNLNEKNPEKSAAYPLRREPPPSPSRQKTSEGSDTRALSITVNNAVEQTPVRYLDADDKERFCTEYTVLESVISRIFCDSDNKWYDLPAGWYVVKGDVTITPRLDTHGAVNLILTDDCHLTVPWGINVKEGDTFTIYAQSTAEASMGKLTACLPELSDHERVCGLWLDCPASAPVCACGLPTTTTMKRGYDHHQRRQYPRQRTAGLLRHRRIVSRSQRFLRRRYARQSQARRQHHHQRRHRLYQAQDERRRSHCRQLWNRHMLR